MKTLNVAIAQFNPELMAVDRNIEEVCRLSEEAADEGARLILFPEGCLTGNAFRREQQTCIQDDDKRFDILQNIADRRNLTLCVGFATPYGEKVNIVHAIIQPGKARCFQHKSYRASTEPPFLDAWPDDTRTVFSVSGIPCMIQICSEGGQPGILAQIRDLKPALVLFPSAGSLRDDEVIHDSGHNGEGDSVAQVGRRYRQMMNKQVVRYQATGVTHLIANPVGFDGSVYWPGNSFIIDQSGKLCAWLPGEHRPDFMKSGIAVAEVAV